MKTAGVFITALALIAAMVGCGPVVVQYTLTISSTEGGSVATPGEGEYTYDAATAVNLVAEAEECHKFVNWTGDVATIGNVTAAATTISMNDAYTISANFEEEAVVFPDANLEEAIREAIAVPEGPIYACDLKGLSILSAANHNVCNLTGLEYCTSLTQLELKQNQISDISALANLTNLTHLLLQSNHIDDISPLVNLTGLTLLRLDSNQIGDISPMTNLTNLTYLRLSVNQISDISPLVDNYGLSSGDEVYLSDNPLSSDSINIYIPELQARGVYVAW